MPIFTDPVILNDGTATPGGDHSFTFRAQLQDKKSVVGEWVEPGSPTSSESRIVIKHDATSTLLRRRLLQRSTSVLLPDNVSMKPITVNLTVTHHPLHNLNDVEKQVNVVKSAVLTPNFVRNLMQGLI